LPCWGGRLFALNGGLLALGGRLLTWSRRLILSGDSDDT
jgi:hypothetical protein